MGGAELVELVGLKAPAGDRRVGGELVGVGERRVGDLEVRRPIEVHRHRPLRRRTEDRPAQVGGDEPGEVVVQRGDLRVGAGVGEIDRPPLAVLAQRLAGVELPAEERVDRQRRVDECLALLLGHAAVVHRVAVVQRCRRVVADQPGLRSEADAADEQVVRLDGPLQMQQVRAALVVGAMQFGFVIDPTHAGPSATVVRLDEQRVADLLADLAEIEQPGVALQGDLEVGLRLVLLGWHHRGGRDRHAEADHRAVRRVLLHRLDRPRVVEHVQPVGEDRLLDPLPARRVPVGQTVDDEVVARRLAQIERLDDHPVGLEADDVAVDRAARGRGGGALPRSRSASTGRRPARARCGV